MSLPFNRKPDSRMTRRVRMQTLTVAGGLAAAPCLAACGDDSPTTTAALANAGWDTNGAPTFLKTAPAGTLLGAAAKNTVFACIRVQIPTRNPLSEMRWRFTPNALCR